MRNLGKFWRRPATLMAVGALVAAAGGVVFAAPTVADGQGGGPDPQVVVCKYVGTPPGSLHHVVIVSENTLKNTPYVAPPDGDSWTDAQGQTGEGSVAIRYATDGEQAKDVSLSECPGYNAPDVEIQVPTAPPVEDPCNEPGETANNYFVVPDDTDQLDWTLLTNGNVTVAPKDGFVFPDESQLVTFQLPPDTGVPCEIDDDTPLPDDDETLPEDDDETLPEDDDETLPEDDETLPDDEEKVVPDDADDVEAGDEVKPAEDERSTTPAAPAARPDQVAGTEAALPTTVDAGLAGPTSTGGSNSPLGQSLMAAGLVLMALAGVMKVGRRERGVHEA